MDPKLVNELLHEDENSALDFKRDQYAFDGADDGAKSELLKDILAFANAWRRTDAYILIGVEDVKGGRSKPVGVVAHHDDAKLQQFVNSKTNRPIAFAYEAATIDSVQVGIIRIELQERPFFLKKDYGKLKAGAVYLRRGSSTDMADPAEVHRMGAAAARDAEAPVEENLKVSLKGRGAGTAPPPFSTGEPIHLAIDLTLTNLGTSPVFIVSADLLTAAQRGLNSLQ
jgi:predicted HTH transcriptional regulator